MTDNPSLDKQPDVDDWLAVETDGRITIRNGKVDIGQRISTAVALIAAEELDVAYERVTVGRPDTVDAPDEGVTSGSNSMEESGNAVRLASATARRHLLVKAADALGVDVGALEVEDGEIRARGTNLATSYAELTGGRPLGIAIDRDAPLKPVAAYRQIGRPVAPRGLAELVTGTARFVHDMTMPGMLHARTVHAPHYHARLTGLDAAVVSRLEGAGIRVVRDGSFLAVAGADEYAVEKAAVSLAGAATWTAGPGLDTASVHEHLVANERLSLPVIEGTPQRAPVPDLPPPPDGAALTLSARYLRPYQMHASLGPSAGLAVLDGGTLKLWTHSQGIYPLRGSMAEALGMAEADIELFHVNGPGCYGHNGADDAAFEASLVALALPGTPVLLKWTRADEHGWEPYSSAMVMDVRASLGADGRVLEWCQEAYSDTHTYRPRPGPNLAGPSRIAANWFRAEPIPAQVPGPNMTHHGGVHRNLDPYYAYPRRRIVKHLVRGLPLRVSAMRTLGAYANIFCAESFIDELCVASGQDPLAFRLAHLDDPRARDVVRAAADAIGWRRKDRPDGVGQGLAFARYKNVKTYAAVAVGVTVDDGGRVRLQRAALAGDAGHLVDRDSFAAQLEGGFLQAASWTLHEQVTWDAGGITSRDWQSYPILGFDNVPEIETVLIDRPGEPFLGAGEATPVPTAAAIGNAVFDATGLRLRSLPLTPDALRAAALA